MAKDGHTPRDEKAFGARSFRALDPHALNAPREKPEKGRRWDAVGRIKDNKNMTNSMVASKSGDSGTGRDRPDSVRASSE
jgi:hypothetical protein